MAARPVLIEDDGEQPLLVSFQAVVRFWILGLVTGNKLIKGC